MSTKTSIKRGIDVVGAGVGIAVLAPLMGVIAAGVALKMGRPVLFRQQRPGLHGQPFELLKFRTMREPRPGEDRFDSDGDRLTSLGSFLRASSLDELPSLMNVLRGDMSLVGPRPLLMEYLPRYSLEQSRRHAVRPGLTGLAQVRGRNSLSWPEKLALDVQYVDSWTLRLDARLLLETFAVVITRHGVSHEGHPTMPTFDVGP